MDINSIINIKNKTKDEFLSSALYVHNDFVFGKIECKIIII